jgi:hypothetical protein
MLLFAESEVRLMDENRAAAIAAVAARGEEIKTASAEFLWICRGVKPPLPPADKPVATHRIIDYGLGPQAFETAMRKDFERLQLRARLPSGAKSR